MSDDQLHSGFEACLRHITTVRNRPDFISLLLAFTRPEGPGASILADDLFSPLLGHRDYTPRMTVSMHPPDSFAVAFHTPREAGFVPTDRVNALIRQADALASELQSLCDRVPARVRQSLCLPEIRDWWRTLFHLAWHFDRPFLSSYRERLLTENGRTAMRVDETIIQQCGCAGRNDLVPGHIFGTLRHDALTATEAAIGILLESIQCGTRPNSATAGLERGEVFARLHEHFRRGGGLESVVPGPKTRVKLMRFTDSFRTPPATEWAGLELGGEVESLFRLARINADQEFCQVRGPATQSFKELATEAGNALLPGDADGAALFSEDRRLSNGFVTRVTGPTPVLSPGAVERWLRFVFSTLKRLRPEELEIRWGTARGAASFGMATLRQDIFSASAVAIELAGLVHTAPGAAFGVTQPTDTAPQAEPGDHERESQLDPAPPTQQLTAADRVPINLRLERVLAVVSRPVPCGPDPATQCADWCQSLGIRDVHSVAVAWGQQFADLAGHIEAARGGWRDVPGGTDDLSDLAAELLNRARRVSAASCLFHRARSGGEVAGSDRQRAAEWKVECAGWIREQLTHIVYATPGDFERFKAAVRGCVARALAGEPSRSDPYKPEASCTSPVPTTVASVAKPPAGRMVRNPEDRIVFDDPTRAIALDGVSDSPPLDPEGYLFLKAICGPGRCGTMVSGEFIRATPGLAGKKLARILNKLPRRWKSLIATQRGSGGGYCLTLPKQVVPEDP